MEKSSFVRNGVVRLPPGFRFHPTDEELVVQYLRRKALASPLPAAVIPEINLAKLDPWDLPGEREGERYFFSPGETARSSTRATRSGYWKATGRAKPVVAAASNELVGMKKVLVFHQGKPGRHGRRTDWVMHEYCLAAAVAAFNNSMTSGSPQGKISMHRKDWVVCRMFKKRATAWSRSTQLINHAEFIGSPVSSSSSSSSSSCVTCLSEEEGDEGSSSSSSNGIASANSDGKVP